MRFQYYILAFFLVLTPMIWANGGATTLSSRAEISVLTCGPGEELYALYGHTAIRVSDPLQGIDRVYNYGLFDFATDNFYMKFIKGDLLYFVDYDNYERFVRAYIYDDRSVYEQVLQLSSSQKEEIWQKMNLSMEKENREYVYRFVNQNCTTKVVDLVNDVLETPVVVDVEGNRSTYRSAYSKYQENNYFVNLGINLAFGAKMDHKSVLLSLPINFMNGLAETTENGAPLVSKTTVLYERKELPVQAWWDTSWFFSAIMLIWVLGMKNTVIRNAFFFVMGGLGIFFIAIGFYSLHEELLNNNSVFLCNPLFLLIPFWSSEAYRTKLNLLISLLLMSLVLFVGLNLKSEKLLLALPLVLGALVSLLLLRNAKRVKRVKN